MLRRCLAAWLTFTNGEKGDKLDPFVEWKIFMGYGDVYKVYNICNLQNHNIIIKKDVIFNMFVDGCVILWKKIWMEPTMENI
jgi:hypothetical protein